MIRRPPHINWAVHREEYLVLFRARPIDTDAHLRPPTAAVLKHGVSAFSGMRWTTCDKAASDCYAANALRVQLFGDAETVTAHLEGFGDPAKVTITMKKVEFGSVQPSRQGVVAW